MTLWNVVDSAGRIYVTCGSPEAAVEVVLKTPGMSVEVWVITSPVKNGG